MIYTLASYCRPPYAARLRESRRVGCYRYAQTGHTGPLYSEPHHRHRMAQRMRLNV